MIRLFGKFLLVMAVLILSSCHIQKLVVEVYTPPRIELPPDVRGILVSSRFVPAKGDYEAVQWGYYEDVDSTLWDLSIYYATAVSKAWDTTARYISRTDFDQRMLRHNRADMPEALPWEGLVKIVEKYKAPGIAILQGFAIETGEPEVVEAPEDPEFRYHAVQPVTVTAGWRLSQPERRRMLDENIYTFTRDFAGQGNSREEALAKLPEITVMQKEACEWAAQKYAALIIPGSQTVSRDYYKDGDIRLEEAHQAMLEGNWGRAESKWNYLSYNAQDTLVKAKASYNMALACERDGRLNQALGFARKANGLVMHRRHLKLINELTRKNLLEEELRARKEIIRNW